MHSRMLVPKVLSALADTPVTFLAGARQTGKSTLALALHAEIPGSGYRTFDDLNTLSAASADPVGFLDQLPGRMEILTL
jgi:uncharacterized protein